MKVCQNCGIEFEGRRRRNCSMACAYEVQLRRSLNQGKALRDERGPLVYDPVTCVECGTLFSPSRARMKFCSRACCVKKDSRDRIRDYGPRYEKLKRARLIDPDAAYAAQRRWAKANRDKTRVKDKEYRDRLKTEDPEGWRQKRLIQGRMRRIAKNRALMHLRLQQIARDGLDAGIIPAKPPKVRKVRPPAMPYEEKLARMRERYRTDPQVRKYQIDKVRRWKLANPDKVRAQHARRAASIPPAELAGE